jgi:hypothetical protein
MSSGYPYPYNIAPQVINNETRAAENERLVYRIVDLSLDPDDTFAIFGGRKSSSGCQDPWLKSYVGVANYTAPIADVILTPFSWSCSAFTIVRQQLAEEGRRGYNIDLYGKDN